MGKTPYIETEALLAVMDDDGGNDRARELLGQMSPNELNSFGAQVDTLSDLIEEALNR